MPPPPNPVQLSTGLRAHKTFTRLFFVEILVSYFFFSIVLEFLNFSSSVVLVSYKPVSYKKKRVAIKTSDCISNYETRNYKDLQTPRLITDHAKKGFYYPALKTWNDIPANIREIQTLGRFKKELKAHLTS